MSTFFSNSKQSGMAIIYALVATAMLSLGVATSMNYFEGFLMDYQENRISIENMRVAESFAEEIEKAYNTKLQVGAAACPANTTGFPLPTQTPTQPIRFCIPNALAVPTMLRTNGTVSLDINASRTVVQSFEGKEFPVYVFEFTKKQEYVSNWLLPSAFAQWDKVPSFSGTQLRYDVAPSTCGATPAICRQCSVDICVQIRFCSADLAANHPDCLARRKMVIQDLVVRRNATFF